MSSPKILILDEPTRGIDVGARYEIYKIVNDLVRQNVTVIIISSDMPEILGMCDRVLVMCSGKLTADMEISECTQEKILQCAIGY
jgi:D-xylose transport system ATP-binding protein